jgi:uncharacterized protein (TIGR00297 family)
MATVIRGKETEMTQGLQLLFRLVLGGGALLASAVIAFLAYRRRSLTATAALTAVFLAVGLYLTAGLTLLFLLLAFFLGSTGLTRYRKRDKAFLEQDLHEKTGARDALQVLANGGPALIMTILYAVFRHEAFFVASAGALAASNADTWASEIGVLSRREPVYILSRKPVQAGLSGGVSPLGTGAALAGGFWIALLFSLLRLPAELDLATRLWQLMLVGLTGFLGSVIDSVLGETLQALYVRPTDTHLTERPAESGQANRLRHGFRWLTNDWVNLLSASCAAGMLAVVLLLKIP